MMTGAELRIWREYLGLTHAELALELRSDERTVRRWESGKWAVPPHAQALLATLVDETDDETDHLLEAIEEAIAQGQRPVLTVWSTREACEAAHPNGPARHRIPGHHRAIAGRILSNLPDNSVDVIYGEDNG